MNCSALFASFKHLITPSLSGPVLLMRRYPTLAKAIPFSRKYLMSCLLAGVETISGVPDIKPPPWIKITRGKSPVVSGKNKWKTCLFTSILS